MKRIFQMASALSLAILLMSRTQRPVAKKPSAGKPAATSAGGGLAAAIKRGKAVYDGTCVSCHQVDGTGVPDVTPTLLKTKWVLGDRSELIKIVLKGMQGVEIDGDRYRNPMPAQENVLSDQQVADVLTYVRNSYGNKASMVTGNEVGVVRIGVK